MSKTGTKLIIAALAAYACNASSYEYINDPIKPQIKRIERNYNQYVNDPKKP